MGYPERLFAKEHRWGNEESPCSLFSVWRSTSEGIEPY